MSAATTILVTGASGGLGRALLPRLVARGDLRVRALVHRTPVALPGCETVRGALDDAASLAHALGRVDAVLHLAALPHSRRAALYHDVNYEGTRRLVAVCRQSGVRRLVHVSSCAAHPDGGAYAVSKLRAEQCVRESGLDWLVLRPAEGYGAGAREGVDELVRWVRKFPVVPILGDGQYRMSPVWVGDVIAALADSLVRDDLSRQILTLAGPETMSYAALIDRLSAHFGVRRLKLHLPVVLMRAVVGLAARLGVGRLAPDQLPRLLAPKDYDIGAACERLGYRPRRLEEGLLMGAAPV